MPHRQLLDPLPGVVEALSGKGDNMEGIMPTSA